ncbi:MAG: DNA-processing protein DprA [Clostridia bacterium]|nr:DNA-processing protein DprA [Clostridia bacterium]
MDKFAHLGALDGKGVGKTIGVLACGLDTKSFYPQENLKVYERIVQEGGAVISEYPIGTVPRPYYFPHRNRLISGLSDKVFVVQASTLKSGSMITVDYALEQGKEVYVYQSKNLENPYFAGNRMLIEEGAKIFKI